MKKKYKKNKNFNKNQTSFYFEDYLETNKKDKYLFRKIKKRFPQIISSFPLKKEELLKIIL